MKKIVITALLLFIGVAGWRVGSLLSADAMGIIVGLLLGVLASVPTALLVLVARRDGREGRQDPEREERGRRAPAGYGMGYGPQPPVIVLTQGQPMAPGGGYPGQYALPGPTHPEPEMQPQGRRFKVVGEKEAWLDEF